ncbi:MAG: ABC transporter substrate-binding protein [Gemmatimonadales bacterium]|jgi:branched-chain amino acid transport system substrate-binding protein
MPGTRRLLLLVALAGLAACAGQQTGTVTFGAAGPWGQSYADANRKGIELAAEEINASPAWSSGRHLDIVFANDSSDGMRASLVAQRFVDSAAVVAVIGHVTSGAMVSAARVYDGHLAAVATTATSPELTGISPWAFRVIPSDSSNGIAIAQFANSRGRKRAAVLYENNPYGRGLADNFRRSFAGQIISFDPIAEGDQDFEAYVSWYKRERPDLVFVAGTDASGLPFLREARRQQLQTELLGGDGWQTMATDPIADGVYVGAPFSAQDPRPEVRAFVDAYRKKFNAIPDGNAALAYDATKLLAGAVEKVGPDRRKIRDYLAGLTAATAYHGVTGTIRFRVDGDPMGKNFVIAHVSHGALQVEGGQ